VLHRFYVADITAENYRTYGNSRSRLRLGLWSTIRLPILIGCYYSGKSLTRAKQQ